MLEREYFDWLISKVFETKKPYRKLMIYLHTAPFRYTICRDGNRYSDGVDLRFRFYLEHKDAYSREEINDILDGPCSVLEMMVALAIRCEEDIMDDPAYGSRISQWFWHMLRNLKLTTMTDDAFNQRKVDNIVQTFLDRRYKANGEGGLFFIPSCPEDLTTVEIWVQLLWYLNHIS